MSAPSLRRFQELSRVYVTGLAGRKALDHYSRRRAQHLDAAAFPWIFQGLEREPGAEHHWLFPATRLFQEPALQYLTGINQTGVSLIFDPKGRGTTGKTTLFLPWKDASKEFWDGVRLGLLPPSDAGAAKNLQELRNLLGIERILPAQELPAQLDSLARREKVLGVFSHDYGKGKVLPDEPSTHFAKQVASLARKHGCRVESIAAQHMALRLPLDSWQLQECKQAQNWTGLAFEQLLPQVPRLTHEHQIAGLLEGLLLFQSPWGLSFPTICAGGQNAATLHYMKNDEPLVRDSMVLLDFGCRSATMHADLSRTFPISGRFNPLQRLLYQIVLDVQTFAQSQVRPGLTIRELNRKVWEHMEALLEERLIARGGTMHRPYVEGRLATLPVKTKAHPRQPHGVSHLMGEQEHDGDPFRLYQDQPLQPGWMISNEPGLYGRFKMKLEGKVWNQSLGIRIEDDLVVTSRSCQNLSENIPKDPDLIETLILSGSPS